MSCKTSAHTISQSFFLPPLPTKRPRYPHMLSRHVLLRDTTTVSPAQTSLRQRYMTLATVSYSFMTPHPHCFSIMPLIAHEARTVPLSFQCTAETCAPELAFARVVEKTANPPVGLSADVWALGATVRPTLLPLH